MKTTPFLLLLLLFVSVAAGGNDLFEPYKSTLTAEPGNVAPLQQFSISGFTVPPAKDVPTGYLLKSKKKHLPAL